MGTMVVKAAHRRMLVADVAQSCALGSPWRSWVMAMISLGVVVVALRRHLLQDLRGKVRLQ